MSIELRDLIDREELLMDAKNLKQFTKYISEHITTEEKINKTRDKFIENSSRNRDDWNWKLEAIIYKFAEAIKRELI